MRQNEDRGIRKRGEGRYQITVSNGYRADGKQRRIYKEVTGTREEARRVRDAMELEIAKSVNLGDELTLEQYFENYYLPVKSKQLATCTIKGYTSLFACHIGPKFGGWKMDEIRSADVSRWASTFESPKQAEKAYIALRAILNAAYDDEFLDEPPLQRKVKLPRYQRERPDIWSPSEIAEAMVRLRGSQFELVVLLMVGAGLRREEAIALNVSEDLSIDEVLQMDGTVHTLCRVSITKSLTQHDGLRDHTKTFRSRVVTIGDPFATRLREILADWTGGPVMQTLKGEPMNPSSIPSGWKRQFKAGYPLAGMRYVELRTMRHSHETIVSIAGISDAINSAVHGHSQQVSYAHYNQFGQAGADRVAEAVRRSFA